MARIERLMLAVALTACATTPAPMAINPAPVSLQGGEVAVFKPTEEQIAYGNMAAVAMRQSRFHTQMKRAGLYQSEDPRAPLYGIVKIVLEQNAFQEIHPGQTKVACTMPQRPGLRGTRGTTPTCGLDRVDVLFQVTSVQILRDSGYVGGYITQVYKDEDRPRTIAFCFIAVWRQSAWLDVRNSLVGEPRDCAGDRKH